MPSKFCYQCGALEEEKGPFIEGLCRDCFLEDNPLVKIPDNLELEICNQCGAYLLNNNLYDIEKNPSREYLEAAKEIVASKIEVLQIGPAGLRYIDLEDSEEAKVGFSANYISEEEIEVNIEIQLSVPKSDKPLSEKKRAIIKIKPFRCEVCSKIQRGYYEAVLQVRGQEELSEDELGRIFQEIRGEFLRKQDRNREDFVSKIKQKHGGLDLYTSTSKLAEDLARFLKNEYGAEMDKSAELIGETEDGERHYRTTVVARLPI